jgi:hypothetical protein
MLEVEDDEEIGKREKEVEMYLVYRDDGSGDGVVVKAGRQTEANVLKLWLSLPAILAEMETSCFQ